jgi:hypothetical protein
VIHLHGSRRFCAARLPVLGPWPALRSGSACPRIARVLSQLTAAAVQQNVQQRPRTTAHMSARRQRSEQRQDRATSGVPVVRDEEVGGHPRPVQGRLPLRGQSPASTERVKGAYGRR